MPSLRFPFSNFQDSVVYLDGEAYPTVEHAFQAAKTLDSAERKRIKEAKAPGSAKSLGRRVTLRPDWEDVKDGVMLDLLRQKFAPGTKRSRKLIAFKGPIVEHTTWHDTYWGVCTCPEHDGKGLNKLGTLLEMVRQQLVSDATVTDATVKSNKR